MKLFLSRSFSLSPSFHPSLSPVSENWKSETKRFHFTHKRSKLSDEHNDFLTANLSMSTIHIYLSIWMYVWMSTIHIYLSICMYVWMFIIHIYQSIYLFVCMFFCLPYTSIYLYRCTSFCLSYTSVSNLSSLNVPILTYSGFFFPLFATASMRITLSLFLCFLSEYNSITTLSSLYTYEPKLSVSHSIMLQRVSKS